MISFVENYYSQIILDYRCIKSSFEKRKSAIQSCSKGRRMFLLKLHLPNPLQRGNDCDKLF